MEAMRCGVSRSALQVLQQVSTMASALSKTRFARRFRQRNGRMVSTGFSAGRRGGRVGRVIPPDETASTEARCAGLDPRFPLAKGVMIVRWGWDARFGSGTT
jgi:hypothetical protein